MATSFSFTMPELRAELRALGHDNLPDHLILAFLSQLNLPLPCTRPASGDQSSHSKKPEFKPAISTSDQRDGNTQILVGDRGPITGAYLYTERLDRSRAFEQALRLDARCVNKATQPLCGGVEKLRDGHDGNTTKPTNDNNSNGTLQDKKLLTISNESHVKGGCRPADGGTQHRINHGNVHDKVMEHYWVPVGERHMKPMHNEVPKEKQWKKEISSLTPNFKKRSIKDRNVDKGNRCAVSTLIDKVQCCEAELQSLTLRLQTSQQCKKPWFLKAARIRVSKGESEVTQVSTVDQLSTNRLATDHIPCPAASPNPNPSASQSSQEHVQLSRSEGKLTKMVATDVQQVSLNHDGLTISTDVTTTASPSFDEAPTVNDNNELMQCKDERHDMDDPSSVCSKSSSGSYDQEHSRAAGSSTIGDDDNPSRAILLTSTSRPQKVPSHSLMNISGQKPYIKKRGGKIDRVARFAEMQRVWKKDTFLVANEVGGKRKGIQSFHNLFSSLHTTS